MVLRKNPSLIRLFLSAFEKKLHGKLLSRSNIGFTTICIDSRTIAHPEEALFVAIKGENHDGHLFIPQLLKRGVRNFIISDPDYYQHDSEACFLKVDDTLDALHQLAAYKREAFHQPVIGITGSNGKTIVKEWLYSLLSDQYTVCKSPKSFNSQVGVPLSVWPLQQDYHTLGVFEAGISLPGEMERLEKIIRPDIGVITNIGPAHDQGFESRKHKLEQKLLLFMHSKFVVYCRDHSLIHELITKALPSKVKLTWGSTDDADLKVHYDTAGNPCKLEYNKEQVALNLPFHDLASIENALHVIATSLLLGEPLNIIAGKINELRPVSMRLELKQGRNNCQLIDDTYNNDPAGIRLALDFADQQKFDLPLTVILSDILGVDQQKEFHYREVGELINEKNVQRLIAVGPELYNHKQYLPDFTEYYLSTDAFLAKTNSSSFKNELILLKGARPFSFEKIVHLLEKQIHLTRFEVNLQSFVHNLNYFRAKLKPQTRLMVMVKAFAYGSGNVEIAQLLEYQGVDYLAVAYVDEGVVLRENGIKLPIMVMNVNSDAFDKMVLYDLEPEIYSLELLEEALAFTEKTGYTLKIHLKIDTGMRRLGIEPSETDAVGSILSSSRLITITSAFTHLAVAENPEEDDYTDQQVSVFNQCCDQICNQLGYTFLRHALNSAGIERHTNHQMDMVRLGIGLYGIGIHEVQQQQLEQIGTLKTVISQIKKVPKGDTIGYGRKGKASKDMKIATIAIGYADGFFRAFSNGNGEVLINGKKAPVIGNVCMDMTMIDVTHIDHVKNGDEVIIFGPELPVYEQAAKIGTIPYELLTAVSERVKRVYFAS